MSVFSTFAMPSISDKAVWILNQILGSNVVDKMLPGYAPPPGGTPAMSIIADVLLHFNQALLGAGLIIFAVMIFVGTMNTANEGQFLGRSWNSAWTPIRLIFGLLFTIPLKSGICVGQKIILFAVLVGIHMATFVWSHSISDVFNGVAQPPIPSYLQQLVLQKVESSFVDESMASVIQQKMLNQGGAQLPRVNSTQPAVMTAAERKQYAGYEYVSITINKQEYNLENDQLPQALINQYSYDAAAICSRLDSQYVSGCEGAVSSALAKHESTFSVNDQDNPGMKYTVFIGAPALEGGSQWSWSWQQALPVYSQYGSNSGQKNPWSSSWSNFSSSMANGNSYIQKGTVVYLIPNSQGTSMSSVTAMPNTTGLGGTNTATESMSDALQTIINTYVLNYQPNACTSSTGACQFSGIVQEMITNAMTDMNRNRPYYNGSNGWPVGGTPGQPPQPDPLLQVCPLPSFAMQELPAKYQGMNPDGSWNYYEGFPNQSTVSSSSSIPGETGIGNQASTMGGTTASTYGSNDTPQIVANMSHFYIPGQADTAYTPGCEQDDLQWWQEHVNPNATSMKQLPQPPFVASTEDEIDPTNDGGQYVNMTNSWWIAGSVYLSLDQEMASSLQLLYQYLGMNANSSNSDLGNVVSFSSVSSITGLSVWEFNSSVANIGNEDETCGPYDLNPAQDGIAPSLFYGGSDATNGVFPSYQSIGQIVPMFYACAGDGVHMSDMLTFMTTVNPSAQGGVPIDTSQWNALIGGYVAPNPTVDNGFPDANLHEALVSLPGQYQAPIVALFKVGQQVWPNDYYAKLDPYLNGIVQVLDANGALSNGPSDYTLPVKSSLDLIFNNLIGSSSGDQNLDTVMQEVYNLGVPPSGGVVSGQFSLIKQVQMAGVSMIEVSINSIEEVYQHFYSKFSSFESLMKTEGISTAAAGGALGIAGAFYPGAGGLAAATAVTMQTVMQIQSFTTMMGIMEQLVWLPILLFVVMGLCTAGIQFSILVPMMPYILFWAGQVAWLVAVLEALVAAPLVMLGLAMPGGHEYAGYTVPAVKMLLGVIFRPVLMVIGLFVGIVLTYVVISFSAQGFHVVSTAVLAAVPTTGDDSVVKGVLAVLLLLFYCTFMVLAFTKCFSPIYVIPEKAIQWIGGQADRAGQEELQQMSSGLSQSSQQATQAGTQATQAGVEVSKFGTQTSGQVYSQLGSAGKGIGDSVAFAKRNADANKDREGRQSEAPTVSTGGTGGGGGIQG